MKIGPKRSSVAICLLMQHLDPSNTNENAPLYKQLMISLRVQVNGWRRPMLPQRSDIYDTTTLM